MHKICYCVFMPTKTKNTKTTADKINQVAMQAGLVLMAAATTIGMLEMPDNPDKRVVLPNQPVLATATVTPGNEQGSTLRREREETAPHYVSYNLSQRTPGRTGRV